MKSLDRVRRSAVLRLTAALALAVVVSVTACSEDPSDVTAEELIGLWGGVSVLYTSQTEPSRSVDLIASEGATYSLQFFPGGTYRTQLSGPSVPTEEQTGAYEVRERRLLLTPSGGDPRVLDLTFNGALLTLEEAETAWDFDDDGAAEPASLELVLDRF